MVVNEDVNIVINKYTQKHVLFVWKDNIIFFYLQCQKILE